MRGRLDGQIKSNPGTLAFVVSRKAWNWRSFWG